MITGNMSNVDKDTHIYSLRDKISHLILCTPNYSGPKTPHAILILRFSSVILISFMDVLYADYLKIFLNHVVLLALPFPSSKLHLSDLSKEYF